MCKSNDRVGPEGRHIAETKEARAKPSPLLICYHRRRDGGAPDLFVLALARLFFGPFATAGAVGPAVGTLRRAVHAVRTRGRRGRLVGRRRDPLEDLRQ